MKFIFPQNYNFNTKILGILDYQVAILNTIWGLIVFFIINFLFINLKLKIFLFIIFVFPILLFSIVGINGENIIDFLIYIIKYIINPKLFFYGK